MLLQVEGLEADQQVNFTVTPENDELEVFAKTETATQDGITAWRVMGKATIEPEEYRGNYDVKVTVDEFVIATDGDDTDRGVVVQVDGLEADQEVAFTVTPEHGNVDGNHRHR